ncbi:vomeronasal type-2 receptor 26-like [Leptodactylus fuscus]
MYRSPVETVTYILMVLFWLIILGASSSGHRTEASASSSQCYLNFIPSEENYEYYKSGDFIIGGLFSVTWINYKNPTFRDNEERIEQYLVGTDKGKGHVDDQLTNDPGPLLRSYAALVAFRFAVDKINEDPELLPNITLGYHAFDAFGDEIKSVQSILQILSGSTPNYSCRDHGGVAGFVGYPFEMQQILQLYRYTMINYGANNGLLNNDLSKLFFNMGLDVHIYHTAIVFCLKHFGWNFVGILIQNDDIVEAEVLELSREMIKYGICTEYIVKIPGYWEERKRLTVIEKYTSQDIIVFYVYTAVYVLAHALHEMIQVLKRFGFGTRNFAHRDKVMIVKRKIMIRDERPKLTRALKLIMTRVQFVDYTGEAVFFRENRKLSYLASMGLSNWVFHQNVHGLTYTSDSKSFFFYDDSPQAQWIHINDEQMKWKTGAKPQSRCNEKCPLGTRKASNGGYHICCYDCVPCSEGEMSNLTGDEFCHVCPEDQWPDPGKTRCVTKLYEFLSYQDNVALFFSVSVVSCVAITCYVIRTFIIFWDTPLVRANNRTVSFILLASILLTFLCVFLFIGCPVDITCKLRQTTFGVLFSVTVSSILAKTIMVCIAFKATKPGSSWRRLLEVRLSYYVVVICSSIQVLICVIWLAWSPPYQDFDHYSYLGKIIIQCNEGSDLWFYSMLGYMGLLAAVSFLLAFMVRTLPDSFNEAKYITFSMLVFCSVWMAMIPAYLSTRGKYMVAVEIFAILASSAGILISIFFPKCYILIKKPELNSRKQLAKQQTS